MAMSFVFINSFSNNCFLTKKQTLKIDSAASRGGHGKYMKYASFPWPSVVAAPHCIAELVSGSRKTNPYVLISISSYHTLQTVQKTISYHNRLGYDNKFGLKVLQYIYHCLSFPMASSMWHFPEPLHLTTSLLQLMKGTDNLQKMRD